MKTSRALRHLLLRSAWQLRQHLSENTYFEFARSLRVSSVERGHEVEWAYEGVIHRRIFSPQDFIFYLRSESTIDPRAADQNFPIAVAFVAEALRIPKPHLSNELLNSHVTRIRDVYLLGAVGILELAIAQSPTCLLLALCALNEHKIYLSRYSNPMLLTIISLGSGFWAGALGLFGYLIHQILDPFPRSRIKRIAITFSMIGIASFWTGALPLLNIWSILLGFAAVALFFWRSSHGTHRQWMPLLLPWISAGAVLDSHYFTSGLILLISLISGLTAYYGACYDIFNVGNWKRKSKSMA